MADNVGEAVMIFYAYDDVSEEVGHEHFRWQVTAGTYVGMSLGKLGCQRSDSDVCSA